MTVEIDDILADASMLARLRRWADAIAKLRAAIAAGANDARLFRMLGSILAARGEFAEAADIHGRLAANAPGDADLVGELADFLWVLDRHAEAEKLLRASPALAGNRKLALRLGRVLVTLGRQSEALPYLRDAFGPDAPTARYSEEWRWLVRALAATDRNQARGLLAQVDPKTCRDIPAALGIVAAANEVDDPVLAESWCRTAIALDPAQGSAWFLLGVALGRLDRPGESLDAFLEACRLLPETDEILSAAIAAAMEADRVAEVLPQLRRLATKAGATPTDLMFAGLAHWQLGDKDAAMALFERASSGGPPDGMVENAVIGQILDYVSADRLAPLVERLRARAEHDDVALCRFAYRSLYLADWRDRARTKRRYATALEKWIEANAADCNMLWTLAGFGFDYRADLRVCRSIAARYAAATEPMPSRRRRDRIRVGWLQTATGFHSTPMAVANIVGRGDRSRFEFYGYSRRDRLHAPGHPNHDFQENLRGQFGVFRDLTGINDREAAEIMRGDDLDVLVELQGLNENNSMGVMAHRPARVSAVYYGFSHSTGADYVDYLFADRVFMPRHLAAVGSEKIVYLPGCHMAPTLGDFHPGPIARETVGLPEKALVLCNFNNPWKHDPESFRSWMRVLAAVPEAVLWLGIWNETSVANLRREAREAGIDPARLIFGPVAAHPVHLKRLQLADLALNSFYVGGGVTSLDTLWAGVPMIATRGMADAPSGYLGASMLEAAGLGELVAESAEAYEALAIALCRDRSRLAALKHHLVSKRAALPLFDIDAAARHVDRACELMFENWVAGRPPQDIEVEPMWTAGRG